MKVVYTWECVLKHRWQCEVMFQFIWISCILAFRTFDARIVCVFFIGQLDVTRDANSPTTLYNFAKWDSIEWKEMTTDPFFLITHIHLVNKFSIVFHWKHSLNNELLKLCAQNLQGNKTWICWTNVAQVRTTTTHQHFNGFRFYVT